MNPLVAHALVWAPTAAVVAALMDAWAALLHRRAWHGVLWPVHRTHHRGPAAPARTAAHERAPIEANDALSFVHAPLAIALILYGSAASPSVVRELAYGIGIGMTAFGVAYLTIHDGLVHGRLPVGFLRRFRYLRRVERAHRLHHTGAGGPPYGLFLGPWELARWGRIRHSRRGLGRGRIPSARQALSPSPERPGPTPRGGAKTSAPGS